MCGPWSSLLSHRMLGRRGRSFWFASAAAVAAGHAGDNPSTQTRNPRRLRVEFSIPLTAVLQYGQKCDVEIAANALFAHVVEQPPVRFVAGFPHHGSRTVRARRTPGQRVRDSQGRPAVKTPAMHDREDRLNSDLIGTRVTSTAVLCQGKRPAGAAPVGSNRDL